VTDTPLGWLHLFLSDREQFVKIGQHQSDGIPLDVGVPQGSVLGQLLFAVYTAALSLTSSMNTASAITTI